MSLTQPKEIHALISMDYAVMYDQYYVVLLDLLMFLCILKLIKLQSNKRVNVLALTIKLCSWDELHISSLHLLLYSLLPVLSSTACSALSCPTSLVCSELFNLAFK